MNKGSSVIELRPNRLLLDPSFGGYKLSLDPIPIYRKSISSGVKVIQPGDNQYSFYHVKIFSLHNHLHVNPHIPNNVYFIDNQLKVFKVISSPPHQAITLKEVFEIPSGNQQTENYNITVKFASPDFVVICDGCGALYFAIVRRKENTENWELLRSDCILRNDVSCVLSDARLETIDNRRTLNVLLLFVEEKQESEKSEKGYLFQTKLKWRTFTEENNVWEKRVQKELCIDGSVDYVALEPGCKSIYIISDKLPKWIYDSEHQIQSDAEMEVELEPNVNIYTWTQNDEEITIWLPLAEEVEKSDVEISVSDLDLEIKVKGKLVVSGKFFHRVNKDLTTWSFEKNRVEIQLAKHETGLMWKTLLPGSDKGEEIVNPKIVKNIHEKLAHLCSDKQETSSGPSFNSQQLEECDVVSCDTTSLFRINGETHRTTHEVSLSSLQWLFKVSCDPNQTPAICVRHDVDACVWQFAPSKDEEIWPHEHVGTFFAFGYVQASKTQKKFVASPPNLSYVVVCEASHHVYVYRQPSPLTSELKNRHTGKKVDTISKQQLVNLEAKDHILGVHATNDFLFVLLENSVCVLTINA